MLTAAVRRSSGLLRLLAIIVVLLFSIQAMAQNAALAPGNIVTSNTTIYDRGGTGNYGNSSNEWITIAGRPGMTITISGSYALETGNYDYIYIRSGYGNAGTAYLTRTNGSGTVNYTGAAGETLTVHLTSDASTVASGFVFTVTYSGTTAAASSVNISGTAGAASCGTNMILKEHAGDNSTYSNNRNDSYVLNNISGSSAVINISGYYNTESGYDYVYIYNGAGTGGTLLASYAGNGTINYTGTAGQTLTVRFYSDVGTVAGGFALYASYSGSCTIPYQAQYISQNSGSATWCAGETRNVQVTIKNTGTQSWTDVAGTVPSPGRNFNIGAKWNTWGDYDVRVDAQDLASGATQTFTLTMTAPTTPGSYVLSFNVVDEAVAWFGGDYPSSAITVVALPGAITGTTTFCGPGQTSQLACGLSSTAIAGGTVTTSGGYRIHSFTTTGSSTFSIPSGLSGNVEALVVAGGGGGGFRHGGGGGAGGVVYNGAFSVSGNQTVVVGAGGTGGNGSSVSNGGDSQFGSITAVGGGFGSSNGGAAAVGGSGGGGSNNLMGQNGTSGQGNKGGNQGCSLSTTLSGCLAGGCGGCYPFGGGGGGAGSAAANAAGSNGSAGGAGVSYSISGAAVTYGGGGGGGKDGTGAYAGGTGGGGAGGTSAAVAGISGTANTGGGGGGGGASGGTSGNGGNGGSGIVIVRYPSPGTWSSSNSAVASVDPATGIVTSGSTAGTATITYTNANGCTSSVTVTVNSLPSASITTSASTVCHGSTVSLGGNVVATGAWTLTLSNGQTATGTGNGAWSIAASPTGTTTYTVTSLSGQSCTPSYTGSTTITLPTAGTSLSGTESATCAVSGTNWIHFYHSSGRFIASINPNGNNLGNVTVTSTVGSPAAVFACNTSSNPNFQTAYMGRSWVVTSSAYPGTNFPSNVSVRLPFSDAELTAVNTYATTATTSNPNDNGATTGNMMMTKFTGTTENSNASDNCSGGTIRAITQTGNGDLSAYSISAGKYVQFNVQQFSEMFLHKNDGSALPVTLTSFTGSCNEAGKVSLSWETSSEQHSDKFIVERSRDLTSWDYVSEQKAAGNSSHDIIYTSVDNDPIGGTSYYRLVQVDLNGKQNLHNPVSVACGEQQNTMSVFPNPNRASFTVAIALEESFDGALLQLTDLSGKVINSRAINLVEGNNNFLFEDLNLESGTYLVNLISGENRLHPVKVVVNR